MPGVADMPVVITTPTATGRSIMRWLRALEGCQNLKRRRVIRHVDTACNYDMARPDEVSWHYDTPWHSDLSRNDDGS